MLKALVCFFLVSDHHLLWTSAVFIQSLIHYLSHPEELPSCIEHDYNFKQNIKITKDRKKFLPCFPSNGACLSPDA